MYQRYRGVEDEVEVIPVNRKVDAQLPLHPSIQTNQFAKPKPSLSDYIQEPATTKNNDAFKKADIKKAGDVEKAEDTKKDDTDLAVCDEIDNRAGGSREIIDLSSLPEA